MNFIEEKKILKAETFLIFCIILGENMEACWERKTTKFIQHDILSKEIKVGPSGLRATDTLFIH